MKSWLRSNFIPIQFFISRKFIKSLSNLVDILGKWQYLLIFNHSVNIHRKSFSLSSLS